MFRASHSWKTGAQLVFKGNTCGGQRAREHKKILFLPNRHVCQLQTNQLLPVSTADQSAFTCVNHRPINLYLCQLQTNQPLPMSTTDQSTFTCVNHRPINLYLCQPQTNQPLPVLTTVCVNRECDRYPDTYVRNKAVDQLKELSPDDLFDLLPQLVQVFHMTYLFWLIYSFCVRYSLLVHFLYVVIYIHT